MSRYGAVLRHPVAARLLLTQSVGELGDFVGLTALVLLAYARTGSALGAAAVYAVNPLLSLATATFGARWLDRLSRRGALVGLSVAGALVVSATAAAPVVPVALLASALLGAYRTAFLGVQAALLGEAVDPSLRRPALALSGTINQVAQVAGILGGAAVSVGLGVRAALLVDGATFCLGALVLLTLPRTPRSRALVHPGPFAGITTILRQPTLRQLAPVAWTCMIASLLPETLAADAVARPWVAAAMAASPLGGVVGHMLAGRSTLLDSVAGVFRAQVTLGAVLAAGAVAGWLWPSGPTFVTVNFLVGLSAVAMLGVQQAFIHHAPAGERAQVNSTMVASVGLLQGAGSLLAGGIAAAAGAPVAYLAVGLVIAATAGSALRTSSPTSPASLPT